MGGWVGGRVGGWVGVGVVRWLGGWVVGWLAGWMAGWVGGRLGSWVGVGLVRWLGGWAVGWLATVRLIVSHSHSPPCPPMHHTTPTPNPINHLFLTHHTPKTEQPVL